ncbi:MAG: HIT domain-containing protein [Chromatiales bacterium]|jgi:diadenosine tetraphosphate (Ap4A) HIT family hydrolase
MAEFELHERLAADTVFITDLPLCRMLLMNDARYPWVILVPRMPGLREIHDLPERDRQQLIEESCLVAEFISKQFQVDKMNVAALGNLVPQLHLHHVGRFVDDPAWPGPVWGHSPAQAYDEQTLQQRLQLLQQII